MTEFIWVKISNWWALEGLVVSFLSFLFWLSLIDPIFHFLDIQGLGYMQSKFNTLLCPLNKDCLLQAILNIQTLFVPISHEKLNIENSFSSNTRCILSRKHLIYKNDFLFCRQNMWILLELSYFSTALSNR